MQISKTTLTVFSISILLVISSEILLVQQNLALKESLLSYQKMEPVLKSVQNRLKVAERENRLRGAAVFPGGLPAEPGKKYLLLFYFSTSDCGSCLDNEINTLNKLVLDDAAANCTILGLTPDASSPEEVQEIRRAFRIRFEVQGKDSPYYNPEIHISGYTPLLQFADLQTNRYLYSFYASPGRKSQDGFIPVVRTFLSHKK